MSDPLPFRRPAARRSEPARPAAPAPTAPVRAGDCEPPLLRVRLTKGERSRLYVIRLGKEHGEWYARVFFNERTQHRGARLYDVRQVERTYAEYRREISELQLDGWALDQATV
jgi:hypothetical protein